MRVVSRMFGPSSVMISAPETSRLRIDSEITASGMDLYHSCGVNCAVTIVETLPSRPARMLRIWCAVAALMGVVRKSSRTRTSTSSKVLDELQPYGVIGLQDC
mgnify:CR=1 FL=1